MGFGASRKVNDLAKPFLHAFAADINVAILAGGLGTRLSSIVHDRNKVAAEVSQKPFILYLLNQITSYGFREVVICCGHLSEDLFRRLGTRYKSLTLRYSQEHSPLGTAGAIRLAAPYLNSKTIIVMNGDSFCEVDLLQFLEYHRSLPSVATVVAVPIADTARFGVLDIAANGKD